MSDDLADDDGHDGREVEEADLLRAEPVHGLKEDGQRRVDAHDPRECLKERNLMVRYMVAENLDT